ncbi:MAG TPA: energy transducer TonB [Pyrinomonadaceae bacterium]|nr:energy transducer TonB [Pyrinomonadaceae bacterium]
MRKILLMTLLALLLPSFVFDPSHASTRTHAPATQAATAPQQAAWAAYTFYGEEFSAMLPEMPALDHTSRIINGNPNLIGSARNYGAYGNNVVYLIRAYDKPREREDLNYFAREYVRSFVYGQRVVELRVQRELPRGKFSGRQYVIASDTQPTSFAASSIYVFLTARHAYVLRAFGADDNHPDVQRFFTSFTLADSPGGRLVVDDSKLPLPPVAIAVEAASSNDKIPAGENSQNVAPSAGATGVEKVYKASEVTRKAQMVLKPEPSYTEKARRNQTTGVVRLRIVLSADGKVTNIVAVSVLPHGLTELAALAARHIKFIPAFIDDRPVSQHVTIEYNFNIY